MKKRLYFEKDQVGSTAYKASRVWRLGPHLFKCDCDIIARLCYYRDDKATYYVQLCYRYKDNITECGC